MFKYMKYMKKSILSIIILACMFMSAACTDGIDTINSSAKAIDIDVKTVQEALCCQNEQSLLMLM